MLLNKIGLYILSIASWITRPFTTLSLLLDGIVYTVVAYVYKIFILMAQIKFSEIYKILEPLIDRVKALIMVLVMFKLGKSLIEYMIDPAKATDRNVGGAALVKNLGFTAALLILYPFIFGVMSDISLLIIGSEDGNYEYIGKLVDAGGGGDTGLLARFIWGSDVNMEEMDVGTWLAHQTFTIFLHDMSSDGSGFSTETVDEALKGDNEGEFVFTKAHNLVDEIDITVEYTLPFVSTIMGLYLIYSIAKVAIEIGVRMFKMIILQILAPLAIITIIDKGVSSPTFKTFCKTYISVFLEAITRIAIVFIITTFVGAFMQDGALTSFFGNASMITENVLTRGLICVIVLVAGYRLVGILPKFIDQALGTNMAGSASGGGFGKFAAGLVGGAIGAASGLAIGAATGGLGGALTGFVSGGVGGFQEGGKGKNIADFFKGQAGNMKKTANNAIDAKNYKGGAFGRAVNNFGAATGINDIHDNRVSEQIKAKEKAWEANQENYADQQAKLEEQMIANQQKEQTLRNQMAGQQYTTSSGTQISFGTDKASFIKNAVDNDFNVREFTSNYEAARSSGDTEQMNFWKSQIAEYSSSATLEAERAWKAQEDSVGITQVRKAQKAMETQKRQAAENNRIATRSHNKEIKAMEKTRWNRK